MPAHLVVAAELPTGVVVALVVLGLAEVALAVYCVVDILRRPAVLGGRKWVWLVVVVLFSFMGALVYLAVGRARAPVADTEVAAPVAGRAAAAADLLYGPRDDTGSTPAAPGSRGSGGPPS